MNFHLSVNEGEFPNFSIRYNPKEYENIPKGWFFYLAIKWRGFAYKWIYRKGEWTRKVEDKRCLSY